ncbi:carbon catabolite repressor protein 46 [Dorcoceras hygrometricum]|uniref:Carbon catabolite repressor protein 46 n=1 Tax=Dorcoceras hygrometricum TaxID=472368 RepID=A0A2Z7BRP9_9LAMI|nr:carbon catabolite repressor protein 46 [Dorcoceras hygrometricum]
MYDICNVLCNSCPETINIGYQNRRPSEKVKCNTWQHHREFRSYTGGPNGKYMWLIIEGDGIYPLGRDGNKGALRPPSTTYPGHNKLRGRELPGAS